MAQGPASKAGARSATDRDDAWLTPPSGIPAFDIVDFDELSDMIGEDGVAEMVQIFEAETRQRLRRLEAGGQDLATQVREMHTLKGAAATVAAPRLSALGLLAERAARHGIAPTTADFIAIAEALEEFLSALRIRNLGREPVV